MGNHFHSSKTGQLMPPPGGGGIGQPGVCRRIDHDIFGTFGAGTLWWVVLVEGFWAENQRVTFK